MGNYASTAATTPTSANAKLHAPIATGLISELENDTDGKIIGQLEEIFFAAQANANVQNIRQHMMELGQEELRHKFLEIDTDGNGLLDAEEIKIGFGMLADQILAAKYAQMKESTISLLTSKMDSDGDGCISVKQVMVFCLGEEQGTAAAHNHIEGVLPRFTPPFKGTSKRSREATELLRRALVNE